jgi:hypothetical protein
MAPGIDYPAPGAISCSASSDLGANLLLKRKAVQKKESSVPIRRTAVLIRNATWGRLKYYLIKEEVTCPSSAILIHSEIDPRHYGIDPQNYRSPDLYIFEI